MARHAQPAGGGAGRQWETVDPQQANDLPRSAEFDPAPEAELGRRKKGGSGSGDSRNILDSLNTAIVRVDHHLLIRQLNAAAENLLGISETRAFGKPFMPLVDDDPDMFATLQKALETGVCYAIELSLAPNDVSPEERIVDCRVSGDVQDGSSAIVELTDVTRRARINRENTLLVQHGAGRQMVRQLAHEIKNPLGGLRGAAQLLDRQLERADLHEYTRIIISEADRLAALVDTLLGPGGPPQKTPQNIHELIEYVVRIVQAETGDRLRIKRDYDPGLPEINLDRDQIVQALLNIVRNAVTALDGYGNLYLRTRAVMNFTIGNQRHRVVASIEIEDDGPGISPELQDSVFYPLVTSRADGTGLGLPVAQELAGRHGGLIEFESRPGRTVFYVRLPLDTDTHDD